MTKEKDLKRHREWAKNNQEYAQLYHFYWRQKRKNGESTKRKIILYKNKLESFLRRSAWNKIKDEIKLEKKKKLPCEICKTTKNIEAHHYLGYEKENWLKVKWLCIKHHRAEHRSFKIKKTTP